MSTTQVLQFACPRARRTRRMDSATSKAALDALAAHTAAVAKLREDLTTQSTAVKRLRSELLKSAARSKLARRS